MDHTLELLKCIIIISDDLLGYLLCYVTGYEIVMMKRVSFVQRFDKHRKDPTSFCIQYKPVIIDQQTDT